MKNSRGEGCKEGWSDSGTIVATDARPCVVRTRRSMEVDLRIDESYIVGCLLTQAGVARTLLTMMPFLSARVRPIVWDAITQLQAVFEEELE